jgi:hypothetical protein
MTRMPPIDPPLPTQLRLRHLADPPDRIGRLHPPRLGHAERQERVANVVQTAERQMDLLPAPAEDGRSILLHPHSLGAAFRVEVDAPVESPATCTRSSPRR